MKKLLRISCFTVFIGGSSAAVLLGFLYLLQTLIRTDVLFFQSVAVLLLACLALAFVAGAVLLVPTAKKKKL